MRTDLIAAWLVYQWLQARVPQLADGWQLAVSDEVQAFAARVKGMYGQIDTMFASQSAIAQTAIALWNLDDLALFGAGTPTPLTPQSTNVKYYTDMNPAVLAEAQQAGYRTQQVNVKDVDDLRQLEGVEAGVATGLFHFLEDPHVAALFNTLADGGIHTLVFNNAAPEAGQELMDQWNRLGFQMYARTPDNVASLLPGGWQLEAAHPVTDFVRHHPVAGEQLAQQRDIYSVYLARYRA